MQMDLGNLVAHLSLNSSGWMAGAAAVTRSMDQLGSKMHSLGTKISLFAGIPLTLFGRSAVKEFGAFDQAITKSMAVMEGATSSMRSDLEDTALTLSTKVATSAVDLAKGYFELGQAGLNVSKSMAALPIVERFAYAGTMNLSTAVSYLTKTQRSLGMEMEDPIENMREMTRVADNLTYAAIESTAEVVDFSEAMKNVGPMLRVMNKSVEEGVSALMALANQGHVGSEAGTQLYMTYRDLQRAFITHKSTWKSFNLDVYDTNGNMLLLQDIISQLERNFANLSDEQLRSTLMFLGFQDRSLRATQALVGHSKSMKEFYKDLKNVGGVTERVANQYLKAFNAQMDVLINKFKIIKISIGGIIADQLLKLNIIVNDALSIWKTLDDNTKKFIVYLGEFVVASGPVLVILGTMVKVFSGIAIVIGTILSPMGLLLSALTYLALSSKSTSSVFVQSFNAISNIVKLVSEKIKNWTDEDSKTLSIYIKLIGLEIETLQKKFKAFIEYLQNDFSGSSSKLIWDLFLAGMQFAAQSAIALAFKTGEGIWEALRTGLLGKATKSPSEADVYKKAMEIYSSKLAPGETPFIKQWEQTGGQWLPLRAPLEERKYVPLGVEKTKLRYPEMHEQAMEEARRVLAREQESAAIDTIAKPFIGSLDSLFEDYTKEFVNNSKRAFEKAGQTDSGSTFIKTLKDINDAKAKAEEEIRKQLNTSKETFISYPDVISTINTARQEMEERWMSYLEEGIYSKEPSFIGPLQKPELSKAEKDAEKLTNALDPYLKQQREAIASLYEGLQANNGAYEAQLAVLDAESVILKSIVGDNAQLPIWYDRQVEILKRKVAIEGAVDSFVQEELEAASKLYDGLKDQTGMYAVKLKLLENEMAVARVLVKDNDLLTRYYERQISLLKIQEMKSGTNFINGLSASIKNMQLELQTFGELGYEVGYSLRNGLVDSLTDAVFETKNLKDAMNALFREISKMIFKQAITAPITNMMSSFAPNLFKGIGSYQGSYTPYVSTEPGVTTMPGMAEGGMAWNPHVTWIAEKEPELVTPLSKLDDVFGRAEPEVTLNINNNSSATVQASKQDVRWDGKRLVAGILLQDKRNNGPISRGMR